MTDWQLSRIEQFAEVVGGGTPSRNNDEYFGEDVPWITPRDLAGYEYRHISSGATNLTKLGLKESSARLLPTEAVLFSSRAPIGYIALARNPLATNQGFRSLVCDRQKALPRFIYYALKFHLPAIEKLASGTTFREISGGVLKRFEMPLPSLAIQNRIASVLSTYDDLIENNLRRIQILEEMAQLLYGEWFIKFRFPGHEKVRMVDSPLGRIPEGWEVLTLGSVADVSWGDTTVTKASYVDEGYDAFSASGLDGRLPYFDYSQDGVVLSAIGANCGVTWFAKGKWSCIKNTIRFWATSPRVSTGYLYLYSKIPTYWTRRGSAQPFISQGDARRCLVLVPGLPLMKAFTDFCDNVLSILDVLRRKNKLLRQTRDLLLPQLISGQLDVTDLDIKTIEDLG